MIYLCTSICALLINYELETQSIAIQLFKKIIFINKNNSCLQELY